MFEMAHNKKYIDVSSFRARVARYIQTHEGFTSEFAVNWQKLEDDAIKEIEAQGGGFNLSGHYPCSPELAARAIWNDSQG